MMINQRLRKYKIIMNRMVTTTIQNNISNNVLTNYYAYTIKEICYYLQLSYVLQANKINDVEYLHRQNTLDAYVSFINTIKNIPSESTINKWRKRFVKKFNYAYLA